MGEESIIWDKLWFVTAILMRKGQACTALELANDSHLLKFTSEEIEAFCYFPNSPLSLTNNSKVTFSHQAFSFFDNIKDIFERPSSPFVLESHISSLEFVNAYLQESNAFALKSFIKHFSSSQLSSFSSQFTMEASLTTSENHQVSFPSVEAHRGPSPFPFIHVAPSYSISCTVPGIKNIIFGAKPPGYSSQSETVNFALEERSRKRARYDFQPSTLNNCSSKMPFAVASVSAKFPPESSDHPAVCPSLLTAGNDVLTVNSNMLVQYSSAKDGCNGDADQLMEDGYPSGSPVSLLAKPGLESEPKASDGEENVCSYGSDSSFSERKRGFTISVKPDTSISVRSDVSELDGSSKCVPLSEILDGSERADVRACKHLTQEQGISCQNKMMDTGSCEAPVSSANDLVSLLPENSDAVIARSFPKHRDLHCIEEHKNAVALSAKNDKQESPFCSSCSYVIVSENQLNSGALTKYEKPEIQGKPENQLNSGALNKNEKPETRGKTYDSTTHSSYGTRNKEVVSWKSSGVAHTNEALHEEKVVTMDTEDQLDMLMKGEEKTSLLHGIAEHQTFGGQNLNDCRQFKKIGKNTTVTGPDIIVSDGCAGQPCFQTSLVNDAGSPSGMKEMAQSAPMHPLKYSPDEEEEMDCSPSDSQFVDLSKKSSDGLDKRSRHQKWFKDETLMLLQAKKHVDGQFVDASSRKHAINSSSKWDLVSEYCVRHRTERSAIECQKKWNNLCTDYKRVRDYEESGAQSYWMMSWGKRKELKLHTSFDREVYDLMEGLLGRRRPASTEVSQEASVISFDHMEHNGDTHRDDVSIPCLGRRKRKDSLSEEELKQQLMASLEATRTTLAGQISTKLPSLPTMISQVPRFVGPETPDEEKPKENSESMACVLEKLAHSLGEIAKKL